MRKYDSAWSVLLDRDGVINVESVGSYITDWSEFVFCDGALDALKRVSEIFGFVAVVTNQRGVGRGIMSNESLLDIHRNMRREVVANGGRIDKVYACTATENEHHNRKPNVGMAIQAKHDRPEMDFKKTIMVGNSLSDMQFGKRMNMHTVFITTKSGPFDLPHDLIDEQYASLEEWVSTIEMPVMEGI